jgi:hypothetical protein
VEEDWLLTGFTSRIFGVCVLRRKVETSEKEYYHCVAFGGESEREYLEHVHEARPPAVKKTLGRLYSQSKSGFSVCSDRSTRRGEKAQATTACSEKSSCFSRHQNPSTHAHPQQRPSPHIMAKRKRNESAVAGDRPAKRSLETAPKLNRLSPELLRVIFEYVSSCFWLYFTNTDLIAAPSQYTEGYPART